MIRPPPRSTRPDTPFPYTPLVRSLAGPDPGTLRPARDPRGQHGPPGRARRQRQQPAAPERDPGQGSSAPRQPAGAGEAEQALSPDSLRGGQQPLPDQRGGDFLHDLAARSEEHTSELQSLMRNSYAVFILKTTISQHL